MAMKAVKGPLRMAVKIWKVKIYVIRCYRYSRRTLDSWLGRVTRAFSHRGGCTACRNMRGHH